MKDDKKKLNTCPKASRCKHGAECICYDTFHIDYLCFESKLVNQYGRYKKEGGKGESKGKKRLFRPN